MARIKGITPFSGNFEPQAAGPLDARFIIDTRAELLTATNWEALDGSQYVYKGMIVSVHSDPNTDFNGLYVLLDPTDVTDINSWSFIEAGESGGSGLITARLIETDNNLIIDGSGTGAQQQADGVNIADGDIVAIFGQTAGLENGLYNAMALDDAAWTRISSFSVGASVSTRIFGVDQGLSDLDSLWMITNPEGSDVVGTDVLAISRLNGDSEAVWDGVMTEPNWDVVRADQGHQNFINYFFQSIDPTLTGFVDTSQSWNYHEIGLSIDPILQTVPHNGANPTSTSLTVRFYEGGDSSTGTQIGTDVVGSDGTTATPSTPATTGVTTDTTFSSYVIDDQSRVAEVTARHLFSLPFYSNSVSIATMTKQSPLAGLNENYYECTCVAETDTAGEKHRVQFSEEAGMAHAAITGIEFYNTVSGNWEWLNGNKAASLTAFTVITGTATHTIQTISRDYVEYIHNGIKAGERQYRFHTD